MIARMEDLPDLRTNGVGLLTAAELARRLGVSEPTVRRLTAQRGIPFYRIGRSVRYCPEAVARWLQEHARYAPYAA